MRGGWQADNNIMLMTEDAQLMQLKFRNDCMLFELDT